jgi:hypothetical protein
MKKQPDLKIAFFLSNLPRISNPGTRVKIYFGQQCFPGIYHGIDLNVKNIFTKGSIWA